MRLSLLLLATLALPACSLSDDPASISFVTTMPGDAPANAVVGTEIDGRTVDLDPLPSTGREFAIDPFDVDAGTTVVSCTVARGDAVTRNDVTLSLEPGLRYGIICALAPQNPADVCMGCTGSARAALAPALGLDPALSLYLVWSEVDPDNPADF